MKNGIKASLQRIVGYRRYLRWFAWFKVTTLHADKREDDFFAFRSLLPAAGIVLDVGANLGFLTAHLAAHVRHGRVIAFEPMPDNLHALRYVVQRFKLRNVTIEPCALGDRDGEAEMVLPIVRKARLQGLSHIVDGAPGTNPGAPSGVRGIEEGIRFTVPLRTLDGFAYLFAPGAKVTGIKIDVENSERRVLAGAGHLVAAHAPLIYLELCEDHNKQACLDLFRTWGYEVTVNVKGTHEPYDPVAHAGRINFLARPLRDRRAPARGSDAASTANESSFA
ncbi:MAG: FkbM family methyltransferase [Vicinamibacterales bacterium]